ncbi:hypothetical protein RYA05_05890 [Pseudomonas syringae pv. actinidiae]|nr:hypothetical protein [Pseudomonas syringae pv. actinidiae]
MQLNEFIGSKGAVAGIGSRRLTHASSKRQMYFACCIVFAGYKEHSGGADLSDTSHEVGAKIAYDAMCQLDPALIPGEYSRVMQIFLPWAGFNGRKAGVREGYVVHCPPEALSVTQPFHPGWSHLSEAAQKMMSRNAMQILDLDLQTPVRFVMCETPDGAYTAKMTSSKTGGTGQAIRIADHYNVPVYNLQHPEHRAKVDGWIATYDQKIQSAFGVSPIALVDEFLANHKGIAKSIEGDLVEMANSGEVDVIIHGVDCFHSFSSPVARHIAQAFPEALEADRQTKSGDKKKLGTYSFAKVSVGDRQVVIVNAYTQLKSGSGDELYVDYESVRKVFRQIKKDFNGYRFAIPRIGAGAENGCWVTLSNIISCEMERKDLTLVDFPEGFDFKLNPVIDSVRPKSPQLGMDF